MSELQTEQFYERLMDLFYAKLFEFAQKRVKGSVNREYSADDVVGTTIRTLLRRKIHELQGSSKYLMAAVLDGRY